MKRMLLLVFALVFCLTGFAYAGPKEVAQIVEAAEREGQLSWMNTLLEEEADPFIKAFNKEYPKIKILHERDHGAENQERLLREILAGASVPDVKQIDQDYQQEFLKMDLLERVNWADFDVTPQLVFNENRLVAIFSIPHAIVFNSKLIKKEEAPRTWEDFLDPKWKGKFLVDTRAMAFLNLVTQWGQEKVLAYAEKIGKQNPTFVRGQTETISLMAAGNSMLAVAHLASAVSIADKGGPIAWNIPDPVPLSYGQMGLLKKAPHPNAAKLFIGWMGSKGYKLMDTINRGRSVPFGGTFTAKLFAGKALSKDPSADQLPDRQKFIAQVIKALGVRK